MAQHSEAFSMQKKTWKAKERMKDAVQLIRETQAATKTVVSLCLLEGWTQSSQTIQSPAMLNTVKNGRSGNNWKSGILLEMQKNTAIWQAASLFFVELYMCWPMHSAMDSYPSHLYL